MSDEYAWWRAALDAPNQIGKSLKITTQPEPGFYRRRFAKNGPWAAVWIFASDYRPGWCRVTNGTSSKQYMADEHWTSCAAHPITQAEYERVAEQGLEWSDADPTVGEQRRDAAKPGSNEPEDEAEILKSQIESAMAGAEKYGQLERWTKRGKNTIPVVKSFITDDAMFAKAQEMRSRLLELFREGETKFHKEKDPITLQGKRVDERWRFRVDAEEKALIVREAMSAYETAKLREQTAADEARRAAEIAAELPSFVPSEEPTPAPAPAVPMGRPTTVKGSSGRAATVGVAWDVTVVDQDALYQYMREHDELKALLLELARRAANLGRDIPGITKQQRATIS